jgi:hypothetical protein
MFSLFATLLFCYQTVLSSTRQFVSSLKRRKQLARFQARTLDLVEAGSPVPTPPRVPLTVRV